MRRLAFLAAASIALIAISEPISANTNKKDKSGCIDKKAYVGRLKRKQITAIDPDVFSELDQGFLSGSVGSKAKKNFKKKCD